MAEPDRVQEKITGFWSAIAKGYEAHEGNVPARDSEEYRAWVREIAGMLPAAPADVLDLATGTGFVASIAASLGHRVTGIDLADAMLAEAKADGARQNLKVTYLAGDVVAPSFPHASFDAVISRHLLWTLRDLERALSAWRRLLRPGGRVIAIDGFWFSDDPADDSNNDFFQSFYSAEIRKRLPGWQHAHVKEVVPFFERAGFVNVTARSLDEIHRLALNPSSPEPSYAIMGIAP